MIHSTAQRSQLHFSGMNGGGNKPWLRSSSLLPEMLYIK
jgi:hypothetical protein